MFDCLPRVCSILQHNTTQPNILQYNRYEGILNKLICETAVQNVYAAYEKRNICLKKFQSSTGIELMTSAMPGQINYSP